MSEEGRICKILNTIQNIKNSKLSITTYFEQNSVPFLGNNTIAITGLFRNLVKMDFTTREKIELHETDRTDKRLHNVHSQKNQSISSSQLQSKILNQFDVKIIKSSLNTFRAFVSLTRIAHLKKRNANTRNPVEVRFSHVQPSSMALPRYTLK